MSPETALLSETWQLFKNYVHIKERLETAEALLELFEEHIGLGDLEVYKNEFDRSMKAAIISKYKEFDDDEDDDFDDPWG